MKDMPKLLYGTAWKKERTATLVEMALTLGFKGVDTACQPKHYEEELFGRLFADADIKPSVLQNRFYNESDYDKGIRAFCDKNGVTYQSFWSLTANPHILAAPPLLSLTKKYQKTAAQIFYRYLTQIGIVPLIGSTSESHLREDLEIFGFTLTSDELLEVESLL